MTDDKGITVEAEPQTGPARVEPDPDYIAQLEAETAAEAQAENDALRMELAPYVLIAALFALLLLIALVSAIVDHNLFNDSPPTQLFTWAIVEAPLIVYAAIVFRRGRFKLPDGRAYEGWSVRAAAALAVLVSLVVFWVRVASYAV